MDDFALLVVRGDTAAAPSAVLGAGTVVADGAAAVVVVTGDDVLSASGVPIVVFIVGSALLPSLPAAVDFAPPLV